MSDDLSYEEAAQKTWRHAEGNPGDHWSLLHELVRCVTLAPSRHNTQGWKFHIEERAISILPDLSRRCLAVAPDGHHLFVSRGCAAENLVSAGLAHGLKGEAMFDAKNDKAHWVEAGRCYERFALQAVALGIRNAMVNQPVEVSAIRPQFANALGIGSNRPDLVVRFGRGPEMPRSLRRPVPAVPA